MVLSTFCGCGGSSLGHRLAGGQVLLAIDHDADALGIYRANLPGTPIYQGDIEQLSVEECCRLAGIRPGELDILDGSPPCQGFSPLGKRLFLDQRNQLFVEFVRLLWGLQPKTFVMENVRGMVRGEMKLIFADCLEDLKSAGYKVRARLLNTKYFHVPQDRERIIFIGVRNDLHAEPSFPRAQSSPQSIRKALGLVGQGGVKNDQFKSPWRSLDEPCVTISKHPPIVSLNGVERKLTFAECSLLQGFPGDWKWPKQIHRCLGNAVPPPFMKAVAEHVRDDILALR
jgi:DNA (cytosine-5)-methyltransferase 1